MMKKQKMISQFNWINISMVVVFALLVYALIWAICRGFDIGYAVM